MTQSLLVVTECPGFPSEPVAAVFCEFKIMFEGIFLGFGATAGGLLGSGSPGGGLFWEVGGLSKGSSVKAEITEVFSAETSGCNCPVTKVASGLVENPAGGGTPFSSSGLEAGSDSSMKSEGGGMRPTSISEAFVDCPGLDEVLLTLSGSQSLSKAKPRPSAGFTDDWIVQAAADPVTAGFDSATGSTVVRAFLLAAAAGGDCGSEL